MDYWTYKWSDLLLVTVGNADNPGGNKLTSPAVRSFYNWIRQSVAQNRPWNQMVREMYTATGSSRENGALNFYQLHKDPIRLTENTTVAFMGLRLTCARCHNHPLEKYTQMDYYKMANLFARVNQKAGDSAGEIVVYNADFWGHPASAPEQAACRPRHWKPRKFPWMPKAGARCWPTG